MLEDVHQRFEDLQERTSNLWGYLDVQRKEAELQDLEARLTAQDLWDDPEASRPLLKRRSRLERTVNLARKVRSMLDDLGAMVELYDEGEDVAGDLAKELDRVAQELELIETQALLSGEHDAANAIVTIHPGAGGTESQDWAEMLLRMYLRWAEAHDYRTEVTDYQPGEEAGIKSVTFLVEGDYAYGYLSAEVGVHRLVRISPFDANARRHTSFASVFVTPEIEDDVEIEIDEKDLRIDTYRSSGAGGQHVNRTDSAVRITHLPTGIVVQCQNERSQHRNRDTAMKILRSKLYELEMQKRRRQQQEIEDQKADIAWGNQIRSYVLHPYRLVKDHRTKLEKGDVDAVLNGEIDDFIIAYLRQRSLERQAVESSAPGS
ncbi:MAG TPA: peptide chain release factor 2 [Acidobacteriota bacterium]|nr:peptide chain release factor 2 [Acidobacteriota bacterium]